MRHLERTGSGDRRFDATGSHGDAFGFFLGNDVGGTAPKLDRDDSCQSIEGAMNVSALT